MCLGLSEVNESEGAERMRMTLDANQTELLSKVRNVNPNVVVLLFCGSSIETDWANNAAAVVYCALGGQAGASAVADVLTCRVNPSGKLAETWPVRYSDVPTAGKFPSEELTSEYREGLFVGYRYFLTNRIAPAFSFGFGLSYTDFAYTDLEIVNEGVEFTLTNIGDVEGTEISQLYVALPEHKVFRPEEELKGFAKTTLAPGESKRVLIEIDDKAFRYFNVKTNKWEIEGGTYELRVGAACDDIRLITKIDVEGTGAPNPYEGLDLSCYESGAVKNVPDAQFAALLGRPIPSSETPLDRNICFRDLNKSRSPILMLVSAIVTGMVNSSYKKGTPDLNALFIYNMPLRAIGKMAGGMADMGLVDALVREAKGFGLLGIIPFLLIGLVGHKWGLGILVLILWVIGPIIYAFVKNIVKNNQFAKKLTK